MPTTNCTSTIIPPIEFSNPFLILMIRISTLSCSVMSFTLSMYGRYIVGNIIRAASNMDLKDVAFIFHEKFYCRQHLMKIRASCISNEITDTLTTSTSGSPLSLTVITTFNFSTPKITHSQSFTIL